MTNNFNNIDNEIIKLDNEENLDVFSLENLLVENIENYKKGLYQHIEELLQNKINENRIIIKKTRMEKL